jgi:hypothetical protein
MQTNHIGRTRILSSIAENSRDGFGPRPALPTPDRFNPDVYRLSASGIGEAGPPGAASRRRSNKSEIVTLGSPRPMRRAAEGMEGKLHGPPASACIVAMTFR